jgi:predicted nucleic acid-binding protein
LIVDASALLLLAVTRPDFAGQVSRLSAVFDRVAISEGIRAPGVLSFEVGNVVHHKQRDYVGKTPSERAEIVRELLRPVDEIAADDDMRRAAGIHTELYPIKFFDASYVALAALRREPLLTADRRMESSAQAVGVQTYLMPGDLAKLEADYPAI